MTAPAIPDGTGPVHACCGSWGPEHRYKCPERAWPATATPEIRRQAVRGDCIAPAHAQIEDLMHGLDYQQRKRLTGILAQVWDDGFGYGQQVPNPAAHSADIDEDCDPDEDNDPCTHCGGEPDLQECDDPIQCCDPRCDGQWHPCVACQGTGLAKNQVIW